MYLDSQNQLEGTPSADVAIPASGNGANQLDLAAAGASYEQDSFIFIMCTVAVTGAATVQADFVTADDSALSTAAVILCSTGALPVASWVIGFTVFLFVPVGLKRYCGLKWTAASISAGKVKAWLVPDVRINGMVMVGTTATKLFTK